jgi:AAA+ superfamily predicted ATPase
MQTTTEEEDYSLLDHSNLISALDKAATTLKGSKLKKKAIKEVKSELEEIGAYLKCDVRGAILFTAITALNLTRTEANLHELIYYFDCSPIQIANFHLDLKQLVELKLLDYTPSRTLVGVARGLESIDNGAYMVRRDVFESISRQENEIKLTPTKPVDCYQFIEMAHELINDRYYNEQNSDLMLNELVNLSQKHKEIPVIAALLEKELSREELGLWVICVNHLLNDAAEFDVNSVISMLFNALGDKIRFKNKLYSVDFKLTQLGWIHVFENSAEKTNYISVKSAFRAFLLAHGVQVIQASQRSTMSLMLPENIVPESLIYPESLNKELGIIRQSLEHDAFTRIRAKLVEKKMAKGLTILFHGPSGTGKTASVYQLAQQTQRPIYHADLSTLKSKWLGQSEKNVRQLFEDYKEISASSAVVPIFLFNEADALISKRLQVMDSIDQLYNTLQNILLEELEQFEGILIATTNLTINVDKAFDRRFLYKVNFPSPDTAIQQQIWQQKLPFISEVEAKMLVQRFIFTGAQIENVHRKITMNSIVLNRDLNLDDVLELCSVEEMERKNKVGFHNTANEKKLSIKASSI